MANAARSDIGRQEVLAKSPAVLSKEWQAKALVENYLIEICRLLGNLCYDCPEGRNQVVDLNCLNKLSVAYQVYRQSTSLPSAEDRLYLVLPGFLHNFFSDNEAGLSLVNSSGLVDHLASDICQMEQDTAIFTNFSNFLTGLSDHESGAGFLINKLICDYLVHHVNLATDPDSIQPIVALVSELRENEPFCLQLAHSGMWSVLSSSLTSGPMSGANPAWTEVSHAACDALVMMSSHQSVIVLVFFQPNIGSAPHDAVSNWLLGGPTNDEHLIQTAALIFGNIAGNNERCLQLVELFLPEATAELLVGLAAGSNHTVTPKVTATLRLVSQNNKAVSAMLGLNAVLVKCVADLSENSIVPALAIEGARLLSSLVRYSQSLDVARTAVEAGAVGLLSSLLEVASSSTE